MLSATNISLQFGGRYLFKEMSFRIGPHDRIGLVGSNGAGKTTLLKLLIGDVSPERGEVAKARFVTVGYLAQEGVHSEGKTLYKEVEAVFSDILALQTNLDEIHTRMGELHHDTEEFQELLELYGELQHKLENTDAFRMESNIEKVLIGLGFSENDFSRQTGEFSGGWQMRIELAKLLLLQPSLLLLDEPTNHLDLDSLQWLEDYLGSYEGAVMIVSHDRRFLDNMTSRTFELSRGTFIEYPGNYSYFVKAKAERKELELAAFNNQQEQIRQTERFIERFRYKATKARQVQSRVKQLEKLEIIEPEDNEAEIHFSFPPATRGGRVAMDLQGITKRYGSLELFTGVDLEIMRGDRIAFVGVNGAGKSTLARIIAGVEPFEAGERVPGHNIAISYFAQHQAEELDPSKDVLHTVEEAASGETRRQLRTLLGSFLFRGDDVFKKVAVLSGGEKSRLALAKMLVQPSNLIIMDEPTNHLDMRSKAVVQEALSNVEASFVIVSHDRDFLDPLVTKVVEFSRGHLTTYLGNVSDYLLAKQQRTDARRTEDVGRKKGNGLSEKERKRMEAQERQRRYRQTKPIQQQIDNVEKAIERNEQRKSEIEHCMADPDFYRDGDRARAIATEYKEVQKELSDNYFQWNALVKELESLNATDPQRSGKGTPG
jgi:ATP-binding cassette subfamily F protein 3